jgi:Flp pilus assembly protein protease CpaA
VRKSWSAGFASGPLNPLPTSTDILLVALLVVCAVTDLRSRLIYDAVTFPCFVAGLVLQWFHHGRGEDWNSPGVAGALAAVGLALLVFGLFHLTGGLGAGDVKLVVAVAAIVGMPALPGAMLAGTLAGGVQGLLALTARTGPGRRLCRTLGLRGTEDEDFGRTIPLGVGLAAGIGLFWAALRRGLLTG